LMVEGQKMSKSLGNFYTLRDLLERGYDPRAIRYLLLSTHYRQQLNFTFQALKAAENTVQNLFDFIARLNEVEEVRENEQVDELIQELIKESRKRFENAMDNDLSISVGLVAIFDLINEVNKLMAEDKIGMKNAKDIIGLMLEFDKVLGLGLEEAIREEELPEEIKEMIQKREEARKGKDWKTADEIRAKIKEIGFALEDTPEGVRWKRIKK